MVTSARFNRVSHAPYELNNFVGGYGALRRCLATSNGENLDVRVLAWLHEVGDRARAKNVYAVFPTNQVWA